MEVRAQAKEGFAVANDGAYLAALVTDLTPELVREGLAREFVRRVQDLRKTADLDVADRIRVYVTATPGLKEAIEANRDYVNTETLTVELIFSDPGLDFRERDGRVRRGKGHDWISEELNFCLGFHVADSPFSDLVNNFYEFVKPVNVWITWFGDCANGRPPFLNKRIFKIQIKKEILQWDLNLP